MFPRTKTGPHNSFKYIISKGVQFDDNLMSCFITDFLVYSSNNKCTFVSNNFARLVNKYYPDKIRKLSIILSASVLTGFNCKTDTCRH